MTSRGLSGHPQPVGGRGGGAARGGSNTPAQLSWGPGRLPPWKGLGGRGGFRLGSRQTWVLFWYLPGPWFPSTPASWVAGEVMRSPPCKASAPARPSPWGMQSRFCQGRGGVLGVVAGCKGFGAGDSAFPGFPCILSFAPQLPPPLRPPLPILARPKELLRGYAFLFLHLPLPAPWPASHCGKFWNPQGQLAPGTGCGASDFLLLEALHASQGRAPRVSGKALDDRRRASGGAWAPAGRHPRTGPLLSRSATHPVNPFNEPTSRQVLVQARDTV